MIIFDVDFISPRKKKKPFVYSARKEEKYDEIIINLTFKERD
jgi:hypothetical protein